MTCVLHIFVILFFSGHSLPESGAVTDGNAGPSAEGVGEQCSVTVTASGLHLHVASEGILKLLLNLGKLHGVWLKKLQRQFDSNSFTLPNFPDPGEVWQWRVALPETHKSRQ